jgi:hypothetical protein
MEWLEEKYAQLRNEGEQVTALRQDWFWTSDHVMTSPILQSINTLRKAGNLWLRPLISKPGTVY